MSTTGWPDRTLYPFAPHYVAVEAGRLHYVDEGQGAPIVMVHGTPDWSFLYRELIQRLSDRCRCLALDHLGFGLSDKPVGLTYRMADHAANFAAWIDRLGLERFTLAVHDFGGPIGLSYKPDLIQRFEEMFSDATVIRYPDVGHFVPDEGGPEAADDIAKFLIQLNPG